MPQMASIKMKEIRVRILSLEFQKQSLSFECPILERCKNFRVDLLSIRVANLEKGKIVKRVDIQELQNEGD